MDSVLADMITRTRERIAHLETERSKLESEWKRIPRLAAWLVLTIPAGFIWGLGAVVIVILSTFGLVVTGAYIIGVRRAATKAELRDLAKQLRSYERDS